MPQFSVAQEYWWTRKTNSEQGCLEKEVPAVTPCKCGFCSTNFTCDACSRKPSVIAQCQHDAEMLAKATQEEAARRDTETRLAQDRVQRQEADEIVQWGGEFWGGVGSSPNQLIAMHTGQVGDMTALMMG